MDKIKILFSSFLILIAPLAEKLSYHINENAREAPDKFNIVTHYFDDKEDPLSSPELFELRDQENITLLFGRFIRKEVCITGECRMVQLWIFWDGVGQFLGLHTPDGHPLTKADHLPFTSLDYELLHNILDDTASILKELSPEDLISSQPETFSNNLDAITSATVSVLSDVVVKDAAYTCFALWHTVYGPVRQEILRILREKLDESYLKHHLESEHSNDINWALNELKYLPEYQRKLLPQIIQLLSLSDVNVGHMTLNYLKPKIFGDSLVHDAVVSVFPKLSDELKYELLWHFVSENRVSNEMLYTLLGMFEEGKFEPGHLRLIYGVIQRNQLTENDKIRDQITRLLDHENSYVQTLTAKFLKDLDIKFPK